MYCLQRRTDLDERRDRRVDDDHGTRGTSTRLNDVGTSLDLPSAHPSFRSRQSETDDDPGTVQIVLSGGLLVAGGPDGGRRQRRLATDAPNRMGCSHGTEDSHDSYDCERISGIAERWGSSRGRALGTTHITNRLSGGRFCVVPPHHVPDSLRGLRSDRLPPVSDRRGVPCRDTSRVPPRDPRPRLRHQTNGRIARPTTTRIGHRHLSV